MLISGGVVLCKTTDSTAIGPDAFSLGSLEKCLKQPKATLGQRWLQLGGKQPSTLWLNSLLQSEACVARMPHSLVPAQGWLKGLEGSPLSNSSFAAGGLALPSLTHCR